VILRSHESHEIDVGEVTKEWLKIVLINRKQLEIRHQSFINGSLLYYFQPNLLGIYVSPLT